MSGPQGGGRIYGTHGRRHSPRGSDPSYTDVWRTVTGTAHTAWSVVSNYSAGALVSHGDFNWMAIIDNGPAHVPPGPVEPEVDDGWFATWTVYESLFVNGGNASPSTAIPNPVPQRYRLSVGPPNDIDGNGVLDYYTEHQVEIQGDVSGLVIGDTVFVIPLEFRHDFDVPYHTHDRYGAYVPCRLLKTGEFIWGQV